MLRPKLWGSIERLPGLSAPRPGWSAVLGEDLHLIAKYLRPTNRLAETLPCVTACTPGCRRKVVNHGEDYVAICAEGSTKYAVACADLIVQELDMSALSRMLSKTHGLRGHAEPVQGLHHTWLVGYYALPNGIIHPVYLMIQQDFALVQMAVMHLCLNSNTPFALFVPTAATLSDSLKRAIETRHSALLPLDVSIWWSSDGKMQTNIELMKVFESGPRARILSGAPIQSPQSEGQIVIERREMADGVHWFADGVDKGVFYKRGKPIKGRILEILYNHIGNGFVPHKTFMNACGWTDKHYFAKGSEANVIQKHLTEIRNFFGVKVLFRIDKGVCFDASIIRLAK